MAIVEHRILETLFPAIVESLKVTYFGEVLPGSIAFEGGRDKLCCCSNVITKCANSSELRSILSSVGGIGAIFTASE